MESRGPQADLDDARRVLAGDAEAFEGIVRRWQGPLVNMAYRFYFLEQDVAEVARVLGLPEGTVKARLHRGRAKLKGPLERALGSSQRKEPA